MFKKYYLRGMRLKAILLLILSCFTAFAQNEPPELRYVVNGNVADAETGRPLQYVSVSVMGQNYATVSNADGDFIIKSSTEPRMLEFSLLGYKSERIKVPDDPDAVLKVRLTRMSLTLTEAMVVTGDPYRILMDAIRKIRDNYPSRTETFDCFYRETIKKKQRYIFISEAVAKMMKTSYAVGVTPDRIAVEKSRILESPDKRDTLSVKVAGGPAQAVFLDIVKNRDLLDQETLSHYSLAMGIPEMIGDRTQFAIKISPLGDVGYAQYYGTIYIDVETLSFTRFDLELDMSDKAKATQMMLIRKPTGLRFTPLALKLRYDYYLENGISRVRYIRTEMKFKCDWKKRLFRTDYTAVSELVTTDLHQGDEQSVPRKGAFRKKDILADKAASDYDPDFWKSYNIIAPTESLDKAMGKLRKTEDID